MNANFNDYTNYPNRTVIYRQYQNTEREVGYVDENGAIYKVRWDSPILLGRIAPGNKVFRKTQFDEREVGAFTNSGTIRSHGLLEGGEIGWVDSEGNVVQAGLIFGEEEVGRVVGTSPSAAGAALLLIFLADEQEETNRATR